jgi:alcohol dehydrogenase
VSQTWRYHNPVDITFGPGALGRIGEALAGRSYALVTYGNAPFEAVRARITELAGAPSLTVDDVKSNPNFETLEHSCARFAAVDPPPEVIVALGGGSVIDTAKVLAAARGDFAQVRHYLETGRGGDTLGAIPIVAVPTTAGTGSEVTYWATVWDLEGGRKCSLARPSVYPQHALVDPELMLGLPRAVTISSGLDALSHALESLWNHNANPMSTEFAVPAARELLMTLPLLAEDLENLELRGRVAEAALTAGLASSNTRTALAHELSYPITLHHGVPHGIACSFSLPLVLRAVAGESRTCDTALKRVFGANLEAGAGRLEAFLAGLEVSSDAADHGVDGKEWLELIKRAFDGERGQNFVGRREKVLSYV